MGLEPPTIHATAHVCGEHAPACYDKPVWTLRTLLGALGGMPRHLQRVAPTLWGRPLSQRFRELVMLAVAAENRCWYCQLAHGAMGRTAGLRQDEVDAVLAGRDEIFARREQLALAFVRDLARRGFQSRSTALYREMRHELSGKQCEAVEATAHVMNFANRFGNTFDGLRNRLAGGRDCTAASGLDQVVVSSAFVPAALLMVPWVGLLMLAQRLRG